MNTLYLDIFSGISGDMFLGAALDLGLDFGHLKSELSKLGLDGYHLHAARKTKASIEGVKFDVHLEHAHEHAHPHGHSHTHSHKHSRHHDDHRHEESRSFSDIQKMIRGSALSDWVKRKSVAVFRRVAVAEGKIHGQFPEKVHFHEVGAADSIVDIVGACIALEWFGKPRVIAAPVVEGCGWVDCAHGRFPIPAAATLEILGARKIALTQCEEPHELVTPTGAALLAEFVDRFERMQDLVALKVGYGLGTRDNKTRPNVLRAVLGSTSSKPGSGARRAESRDWETDSIAVLETNLDDCTSEVLGYFMERALSEGALDVFHTPIQMKKNRPGVLLTVLCEVSVADRFAELMLRETSAFGVRRQVVERWKLRRQILSARTSYGVFPVKLGTLNEDVVQVSPEFEACGKAASERGVPLREVYRAVLHEFAEGGKIKKSPAARRPKRAGKK